MKKFRIEASYTTYLHLEVEAEDQDHADEQALNAYPNGEIINAIIKEGV